ncbi:MAG: TonB-dependent receptor plug domain-containing protein, partial [Caldimicrobium sp.]
MSTLEEIVVTATRVEEPKREVPASVQVISEEDIQNSVANDVGDLMTEAGVGHVHKYPGALTARVGVRGLATDLFSMLNSRVLVLIDGHLAGTVNLAKIPVDGIERIEIVKGPASVLYGSSAMGGVINVITKKAKKEGVQGFVGLEGGSWEYWKALSEVSVKKSPIDFYFTASRYSSDDYKAKGYGKIDNTQENYITLLGRLGYKIFGDSRISLGFQHARGWHIGSPNARYSPDPDDYSNKGRTGFDIDYQSKNFNAKYYLVKDKDEWHGSVNPGPGINYISITRTDTQGANLQHNFSFGPHRLIVGGQWDRIEVKSSRRPGAPYRPNSKYDTYGIYSEGRLNLLNNKVLLSAGIRYDYFENRILSTPGIPSLKPRKENLDHITARGGLVWKITEALNFKANYGTGFRAPAPDELAADYVSSWGTRYLGNPNLKPEKSITTDVGFDYSKGLLKG